MEDPGFESAAAVLPAGLADSFEPERVRYELTRELVDFTAAVLRRLVRPAWAEVDLRAATFTLTPGTRLLSTRHDWQPDAVLN